jgi:hypothetical protein
VHGDTYYAYNPATHTYWAGASLMPSPGSYQAGVANQDDGAYVLFTRPSNGTWAGVLVGLAGFGTTCPETPPPGVIAVWGWPAHACRPDQI